MNALVTFRVTDLRRCRLRGRAGALKVFVVPEKLGGGEDYAGEGGESTEERKGWGSA